MREKLASILFVIVLAFLGVFCAEIFYTLFVKANDKFADSASEAFLGAFLAFIFVRIGDFFKAYSDRVTKNHTTLVRFEHALNGLISTLDDNIYIIEVFESTYTNYAKNREQKHVFIWANKLHPVSTFNELIPDLLNIDLVNELFSLSVLLRKLNESMETINFAYTDSKDALISNRIDVENYLVNITRIRNDLLVVKKFLISSIDETTQALASVRILMKKRPLLSYFLLRLAGHKYSKSFNIRRKEENSRLKAEMAKIKNESKEKIDKVLTEK